MERLWRDTPPEIEERMLEGLRRMTPAEKIQRVVELNRAVETMAAAGIKARHGADISERELRLRMASLRLPRETMIELFDWDPEEEGY